MKMSKQYSLILALAVGLPSTILGVSYLVYLLMEKQLITPLIGILVIFLVVSSSLYLMVRYAIKK